MCHVEIVAPGASYAAEFQARSETPRPREPLHSRVLLPVEKDKVLNPVEGGGGEVRAVLFSELQRTFEGPKPYAEPDYEYLDRSARIEAISIRETMEEWLARYPEPDRPDLVARFRSPDEVQHRGAAFELYLHELLSRLGYELTIHPPTPSKKDTRPDFLAKHESEGAFYVEAV